MRSEVLQSFYCAGFDGRRYPMPLRMIGDAAMRRDARDAYGSGKKDFQWQERYLRMIGRIH